MPYWSSDYYAGMISWPQEDIHVTDVRTPKLLKSAYKRASGS